MAEDDSKTDKEIEWNKLVNNAEEADSQQRQGKSSSERSFQALREMGVTALKIVLALLIIYALFYGLTFNILSNSHSISKNAARK